MKITEYDHQFNANEWFVLVTLVIGFLLFFIIPKRFSVKERIFFLLFGMYSGKFFDHTISIKPFDFYDVNDNSSYQLIDFASYAMFAPFGYFFMYIYDKLQLKKWMVILYILTWSIIAIVIEYIATKLGVYHYKNGYKLLYGLPIYILTQSLLIGLHTMIRRNNS